MKLKVVKTDNGEVKVSLDETKIAVVLGESLTDDQTTALEEGGFEIVESDEGMVVEIALDEVLAGAEDLRKAGFEDEATVVETETESLDENFGKKDDEKPAKKKGDPKEKESSKGEDDEEKETPSEKKGKEDEIEESIRYEVPKTSLTLAKARKALTEADLSSTVKTMGKYVEITVAEGEDEFVSEIVAESVDDVEDHVVVGEGKSFCRVIDEAGLGESFGDLKTLFEASVGERVATIREDVMAEIERRVEENTLELTEGLEEVTARAVGEWVAANEGGMVDSAKARKGEILAEGLKTLLEEVGIEIAESDESEVDRIGAELEEARKELEQVTASLEEAREERDDALRESAVLRVAEGADLTVSQRHRLEILSEAVDENFEDSIWNLARTHFSEGKRNDHDGGTADTDDVLLEDNIGGPKHIEPDNPVNQYLRRGRRITFQ